MHFLLFCVLTLACSAATARAAWVGTVPVDVSGLASPAALLVTSNDTLLWVTNTSVVDLAGSRAWSIAASVSAATIGRDDIVYYLDGAARVHRWSWSTTAPLADIDFAFSRIQAVAADAFGARVYIADGTSAVHVYDVDAQTIAVFVQCAQPVASMVSIASAGALAVYNTFAAATASYPALGQVTLYNASDAATVLGQLDGGNFFAYALAVGGGGGGGSGASGGGVNASLLFASRLGMSTDYSAGSAYTYVTLAAQYAGASTVPLSGAAASLCSTTATYAGVELDGPAATAICQRREPYATQPIVAASRVSDRVYMFTPGGSGTTAAGLRLLCPSQSDAYAASTWTRCGCGRGQTVNYAARNCSVCPSGTYVDTVANACATCPSGTYSQLPVGTACTACAAGSFAAAPGQVGCQSCAVPLSSGAGATACSVCAKGSYSPQQRGCFACATGTYSNVDNQPSCAACPSGYYTYANDTGLTACRACAVGHAATTATACDACAIGRWSSTPAAAACVACAAGYTTAVAGASFSVQCAACAAGTASDGAGGCASCSSGSYTSVDASRACSACPVGRHQASANASTCDECTASAIAPLTGATACTACPAGTYADATRTRCVACALGTFLVYTSAMQNATGNGDFDVVVVVVASCGPCPAGSKISADLTACTACDPGFASAAPDSLVCAACAPGRFAPENGASACVECPLNSYASAPAASSCDACTAPEFTPAAGASACSSCGVGYVYANASDAVECVACTPGTVYALVGGLMAAVAECVACASGTFSGAHAVECVTCADGATSNSSAATCSPCAPGTYSSGGATCADCEPGTYAARSGASACTACAGTLVALSAAALACVPCADGRYGQANATRCDACPPGFYGVGGVCVACAAATFSASEGATRCEACSPSSWCPIGSAGESALAPPAAVRAQTVAAVDPLAHVTGADSRRGTTIAAATLGAGFAVLALAFAAYAYARRHATVKTCFRTLDLFYARQHYVADGAPMRRVNKAVGGFATLATCLVLAVILVTVVANSVYAPAYATAASPLLPPFFPSGALTLTLRYYGVTAATCAASFVDANDAVAGAMAAPPDYDAVARTCTNVWQCGGGGGACTLGVAPVAFSCGSRDPAAFASAIAWTLEFPAYTVAPPSAFASVTLDALLRFQLSGSFASETDSVVLRSLSSSSSSLPAVAVKHIPVVVQLPSGEKWIGSLGQVASSVAGVDAFSNQSQVAVVSLSLSAVRLGVSITVTTDTQTYAVTGAPANWLFIVGTCASYVTGVLAAVGGLMLAFERCFPKQGPSGFRAVLDAVRIGLRDFCSCCYYCRSSSSSSCRRRLACDSCLKQKSSETPIASSPPSVGSAPLRTDGIANSITIEMTDTLPETR